MHKEIFSDLLFNSHYFGVKTILSEKQDYLDINGRLTVDYKTNEWPFSEFDFNFNKRIFNVKKFSGYLSIGVMYQNYYSTTGIWSLQAGLKFNLH